MGRNAKALLILNRAYARDAMFAIRYVNWGPLRARKTNRSLGLRQC